MLWLGVPLRAERLLSRLFSTMLHIDYYQTPEHKSVLSRLLVASYEQTS